MRSKKKLRRQAAFSTTTKNGYFPFLDGYDEDMVELCGVGRELTMQSRFSPIKGTMRTPRSMSWV
jgi:hypothetical protein